MARARGGNLAKLTQVVKTLALVLFAFVLIDAAFNCWSLFSQKQRVGPWVSLVCGLLLAASVPFCGYFGADHKNRGLTITFAACTGIQACCDILAIIGFITIIIFWSWAKKYVDECIGPDSGFGVTTVITTLAPAGSTLAASVAASTTAQLAASTTVTAAQRRLDESTLLAGTTTLAPTTTFTTTLVSTTLAPTEEKKCEQIRKWCEDNVEGNCHDEIKKSSTMVFVATVIASVCMFLTLCVHCASTAKGFELSDAQLHSDDYSDEEGNYME